MIDKPAMRPGKTAMRLRNAAGLGVVMLLLAAVMWCIGIALSMRFGTSLSRASSGVAAAALAGSAAWLTYHVVSRRDVLGVILAAAAIFIQSTITASEPFLDKIVIALPIWIGVAWVMGLWVRVFDQDRRDFPPGEPLYDAEVDHPS